MDDTESAGLPEEELDADERLAAFLSNLCLFMIFSPFKVLCNNRMLNTAIQRKKFRNIEDVQKGLSKFKRLRMVSDFKDIMRVGAPHGAGSLRRVSSLYLGLVPYSVYLMMQASLDTSLVIYRQILPGQDQEEGRQVIFEGTLNLDSSEQKEQQAPREITLEPVDAAEEEEDLDIVIRGKGLVGMLAMNVVTVLSIRMANIEYPHKRRVLKSVKELILKKPFRSLYMGMAPLIVASFIQRQGLRLADSLSDMGAITVQVTNRDDPINLEDIILQETGKKLSETDLMNMPHDIQERIAKVEASQTRYSLDDHKAIKSMVLMAPIVLTYFLSFPWLLLSARVMNSGFEGFQYKSARQSNIFSAARYITKNENFKLKRPWFFQKGTIKRRSGFRGFWQGVVPGLIFYMGMRSVEISDIFWKSLGPEDLFTNE